MSRMMLARGILRVAGVVVAASFCATGTAVGQGDAAIDGIQGEIAAYKSLEAETIAPYAEQLPLLVEEYLVALMPFPSSVMFLVIVCVPVQVPEIAR